MWTGRIAGGWHIKRHLIMLIVHSVAHGRVGAHRWGWWRRRRIARRRILCTRSRRCVAHRRIGRRWWLAIDWRSRFILDWRWIFGGIHVEIGWHWLRWLVAVGRCLVGGRAQAGQEAGRDVWGNVFGELVLS